MKNPRVQWKPKTGRQKKCTHGNQGEKITSHRDSKGRGVSTCECGLTLARSVLKAVVTQVEVR